VERLSAIPGKTPFHHMGDLLIALQKLESYPVERIRIGNASLDHPLDVLQDILVIPTDAGRSGMVIVVTSRHGIDGCQELVHASIPSRDHRDNGDTKGRLQHLGLDVDPLLFSDVHHVQRYNYWSREGDELRHQIEATLENSSVDQGHDHIRALPDDELAGDNLLGRVRGQAVGPRQIDQPIGCAIMSERALFPLDGLPGPIPNVLIEAGEEVEERRFSHIGLTSQSHQESPILRLGPPDHVIPDGGD
jgi:hypothetical protein